MPCCAFAAFIVGQILIGFDAFKRFVLRGHATTAAAVVNPATEWRLGAPMIASRTRSRFAFKWIAIAAPIEIALMLGAGYGLRDHVAHMHGASALQSVICRSPRTANH
jgi:hypothetical protein